MKDLRGEFDVLTRNFSDQNSRVEQHLRDRDRLLSTKLEEFKFDISKIQNNLFTAESTLKRVYETTQVNATKAENVEAEMMSNRRKISEIQLTTFKVE